MLALPSLCGGFFCLLVTGRLRKMGVPEQSVAILNIPGVLLL